MRFPSHIVCASAVLAGLAAAASFTNPLKNPNGSDPFIVYDGGYYYLTTTTWTDIQVTRAKTLNGLKTGEKKTVWKDSNSDRCCQVWAPEIHKLDGVWYIYYSAGKSNGNLDYQRSFVIKGKSSICAVSTSAQGLTQQRWCNTVGHVLLSRTTHARMGYRWNSCDYQL